MSKGEQTNEEKLKIVQKNREQRKKAKNFINRIKHRWDTDFPQKKEKKKKRERTSQKLVDNARQFKKETLRPGVGANIQTQRNIDWTTEIKLVKMEDEERSKGRGFMRRVKERWDFSHLSLRIQYA